MKKANSDWSFGQEFIFIAGALFSEGHICIATYEKKKF